MDTSAEEPARKRKKAKDQSDTMLGICVVTARYDRCWTEIMSYTTRMDDMLALMESCSYLRSTLENFVTKTNPDVMIDGECLNRYPLEEYDPLYRQIRPLVSTLTIYKVCEDKLELLGSYFKDIRSLHIKRILIFTQKLEVLFPNLLQLKLTECAINDDKMNEFISAAQPNIHYHFNKSTIGPYFRTIPWDSGEAIPEHLTPRILISDEPWKQHNRELFGNIDLEFKKLTNVTFERTSCKDNVFSNFCLNGVTESLRIVNCDESITLTRIKGDRATFSKLKNVSLETSESVIDFVENLSELHLDSLEMLTMSHLHTHVKWLRGLKKLNKLRILLPIFNYQEVALLEALSVLKNVINVEYSISKHVPPKAEVNKIVNILNEDCLREILTYLNVEDIFNLALVHSRFKDIISSVDVSSNGISFWINKKFLSRHPLNQQLIGYEALGHSLSKLALECSEDEFTKLAPFFHNLRDLYLENVRKWQWTEKLIEIFPMVESLHISPSSSIPTDILKKLQPTLRVYNGMFQDHTFVPHLHNLRVLHMSGDFLSEDLREFWKHNQGLEALHLFYNNDPNHITNQDRNWKEIASLKNLSVLHAEGDSEYDFHYNGPFPSMNHVKWLSLGWIELSVARSFLGCIGKQLEELKLSYVDMTADEILPLISGFKNLKYFKCWDDYDFTIQQVIQWMIALPMLCVFEFGYITTNFYVNLEDLQKFLSESKRVLYLNGGLRIYFNAPGGSVFVFTVKFPQ